MLQLQFQNSYLIYCLFLGKYNKQFTILIVLNGLKIHTQININLQQKQITIAQRLNQVEQIQEKKQIKSSMVYWLIAEQLGYFNVDRVKVMQDAKDHISSSLRLIQLDKLFPTFSNFILDSAGQQIGNIIIEYICTLIHTIVFAYILYFTAATSSYFYFFVYKKKKYLPEFKGDLKIAFDIKWSCINIFVESFLVSALRLAMPRFSMIYYDINDHSWLYIPFSILFHMMFDETLTYWVHRWLHTFPYLYTKLHVVHHRSKDVTPFSGFAFHPLDAFAQAVPTFVSCYFFPLHINILLGFSLITTIWAISIHDNVPLVPCKLFLYSTHHSIHHEAGRGQMTNYGKFTSVWDRICQTYWDPDRVYFGWDEWKQRKGIFSKFNSFYSKIVPDKSSEELNKQIKQKKN
ncbi:C-5 sterol desaturase (macronuclear) [Tetrahymena thermophila SB210]|uniref:C-5 sterol desaturase n=1 Tax=Tetrahymena thermophila (strain SB210) TaxID=312017 RepID=Q22AK3_TETTS|nr:C-5 sterol desaturase [Tetrahymena thermophila SB210]EAR82313.2 C-5 sterol desaturase [Tetrahymena thermophila SB210]|eukprot:XP_001029976.2 C-5 sterol desaturase [Tetrahymena thermophila SB210]